MTGDPGQKASRHVIEAEAYRRIMAGEAPATLAEFARQLQDWFRQRHPDASPTTPSAVEDWVRETWHRRHELIRGG